MAVHVFSQAEEILYDVARTDNSHAMQRLLARGTHRNRALHRTSDSMHLVADGVIELCAEEACGWPRQALQYLPMTWTAESRDEAAEALATPVANPQMLEFCNLLVRDAD